MPASLAVSCADPLNPHPQALAYNLGYVALHAFLGCDLYGDSPEGRARASSGLPPVVPDELHDAVAAFFCKQLSPAPAARFTPAEALRVWSRSTAITDACGV